MSITLLGSYLLTEEIKVSCYLVGIQASQRLAEDNKADCYPVVFQVSQRLTGEYEINYYLVGSRLRSNYRH